jgi:hypothetical protein
MSVSYLTYVTYGDTKNVWLELCLRDSAANGASTNGCLAKRIRSQQCAPDARARIGTVLVGPKQKKPAKPSAQRLKRLGSVIIWPV